MTETGDNRPGSPWPPVPGLLARCLAGTLLVVWGATNIFKLVFDLIRMPVDDPTRQQLLLGAAAVLALSLIPLIWGVWLLRRP